MRILLINHEFTITGASTVLFSLAKHWLAQGHRISVCPCNPAHGPIEDQYISHGIPVVGNGSTAEFDIVFANTIGAAGLVLQLARRLPTIWLIHEAEVGLSMIMRKPEIAAAFPLAAAVIYQTDFQRDLYRSFTHQLHPSKLHVIPNGVDVAPERIDRAKVVAKHRLLRVVSVGTIEPRKRAGDLIRAAALSGLDIECTFIGKFFELDEQASALAARDSGRFHFNGETPSSETLGWIESADVFCLPSISESQPLSVFEAAILGKALLLSDLPAYHDVFSHGRNALLFPPGHVELLALTLRMYAASSRLRNEMGAAAQKTARRFAGAAFFQRIDALVQSVLAGSK